MQVGETLELTEVVAMPHATAIMQGDNLHGMYVVCGSGLHFKKDDGVDSVCELFAMLLSCYYFLDLSYFAAYGLLAVLDRFVLHADDRPAQKKTRGRKKKEPTSLESFIEKLQKFKDAEEIGKKS